MTITRVNAPTGEECGEARTQQQVQISVIVCTHDHAASLGRALQNLSCMEVPGDLSWELIVVDNNSHDKTRSTIEEFFASTKIKGGYRFEARQGLSFARNRGIQESLGDILAFTDDDILVTRTWLAEIARVFETNEAIQMAFGRTKLYREGQARLAVKDEDQPELFVHPHLPFTIGLGNNMIIRRSSIERIGLFDVAFGPGTPIGAADDADYIHRALRFGSSILYAPSIVVYHDHDRVSEEQIRRIQKNYQKSRGAFFCKYILRGDIWALRWFYWDQLDLWKDLFRSPVERRRALQFMAAAFQGCMLRMEFEIETFFGKKLRFGPLRNHAGCQ